ncbi:hypothetical protein MNB_SV-13-1337 [hydrothermal vent metagenome]|uniref:Uncharacterized protein n=1 Tax=hydrothermal vent metagenome TaxID=652676 RepID=A0A1W1D0U2_9ZZZZ
MLANNLNNSSSKAKALVFKTNTNTFINELNNQSDINHRNNYIREFLLKSDIQCRDYLSTSKQEPQKESNQEQNLYMNIFDTISTVFGIQYISNTAKLMLSGDKQSRTQNQEEYKKALSPEIQRGVEINRERYAKKMLQKSKLPIKDYSISKVQKDILIYDKQCNEAYGLIEINRALKAMQQNVNRPTQNQKTINIESVKKKVENVTKKVQKKEVEKKKEQKVIKKENNATNKTI